MEPLIFGDPLPISTYACDLRTSGITYYPPEVLTIGPDPAGNLLEIIWLELDEVNLVIHAMPLRPQFYDLLQSPEEMP